MDHALEATTDPAAGRLETVKSILDAAGGPGAIADASEGAISIEAVYKWPRIGIPDRHWSILMRLCQVTAEELYSANLAARTSQDPV